MLTGAAGGAGDGLDALQSLSYSLGKQVSCRVMVLLPPQLCKYRAHLQSFLDTVVSPWENP